MSFAQPFSDYEILARVGAGAMGTVFKARQKRLDRIVALKVLRPSLARNTRYVERLRREAHIVAQFNHPNIVTGLDLGEEGGYHFFVMEYVEGQALKDLLQQWGSFPAEQVLDVAMQVAQALDHALQKGVIHRDIKPGNILIEDATGRVKVTDLGLAKAQGDLSLTREGATVGTPQYISPEQARSPQDVDIRSDLYSLGATLYHMATGRAPFRGESMAEVITKVLSERAQSAADLNPDLGDGLSLVIRKLMAKDQDLRYQTPAALLEDLERVRENEAPAVDRRRLEAADRPRRAWSPGRRSWWAAAALASMLACAGLGVFLGRTVWADPTTSHGLGGTARERLESARAQGPAAHLVELGAQLARTSDEGIRGELEGQRVRVLAELNAQLVQAVEAAMAPGDDGAPSAVERWADDPANWDLDDATLSVRLLDPLLEPLGWSSVRLPDGVDRVAIERLREVSRVAVRSRVGGMMTALQAYLDADAAAAVLDALAERDFVGARAAVASAFGRFDENGSWPAIAKLPPGLGKPLRERVQRFESAWGERIAAEEQLAAARIRRDGEGLIGALEARQLELLDAPGVVLERLRSLRDALRADHPPSSRFGVLSDPWPELERRLDLLEQRLDDRQTELELRDFRDRISLAYSVLVARGDTARARELVARFEPRSAALVRAWDEHRSALRAAQVVMDALLDELAKSGPVALRLRLRPGLAQEFTVHGEAGERVIERVGAVREVVSPSEVVLTSLLQAAMGRRDPLASLDPAIRTRGLAVWAGVSGDLTAESVPDADAFVAEQIWPMLGRLRGDRDRFGPLDQGAALARLQVVRDRAERERGVVRLQLVQQLNQGLERARSDYPWTEGSDAARRLVAFEQWAHGEAARLERELSLAQAIPTAQVRVGMQGAVTVAWDPPGLLDAAVGTRSWRMVAAAEGDHLVPDLADARGRIRAELALADPLSQEAEVEAWWSLRFDPPTEHALWLFECRGVVAALSIFGQDRSLRVGLLPADDATRGDRIAAALSPGGFGRVLDGGGPTVVPGARYQVGLQVGPCEKRGCVRVRFMLETEPLTPWTEVRAGDRAERIAVRAAAPVALVGLELRSPAR